MSARVHVILAARNGGRYLPTTLEAIDRQSARRASFVAVDASSSDDSKAQLLAASPDALVTVPARTPLGAALERGVAAVDGLEPGDWLWLLAHDAAPAERALEHLLVAVETSPSVVIVGPKVMRAADPDTIAEYGETMTPAGASVRLHAGELDQGQHDDGTDTMGVAETGMLVRADVFRELGGFDPALPSIDAGLDLGIRARLAGHRVALEPRAKVRRAGGAELFSSRAMSDARHTAVARRAQLHRRLAYAHPVALVLQWLAIVPLAIGRSVMHVLAKRPAAVVAEWAAAFGAAVSFGAVARARRRIRSVQRASWRDLRPLRMSWRRMREHRRLVGDDESVNARVVDERVGFVEGGGLWVVALAAVVGVLTSLHLIGAVAATGGALMPLSGSIGDVWANAMLGQRDALGDVVAPADPFVLVLALLGSATFWAPSLAPLIVLVAAPALAALTGWYAVRTISTAPWAPAVGAMVWGFAPTLLTAVQEGRLGPVIAHVLAPVVLATALKARRSWRAAAGGALALAAVVASAPSLVPAALIALLVGAALQWRTAGRLLAMALPALALFAPLALWHASRGTPLATLADPGVPFGWRVPTPSDLALGMPTADLAGWDAFARVSGLGIDAGWVVLVIAVPLLLAAFAAPFLRVLRGLPPITLALLGVVTAVLASRIALATDGDTSVAVWAGSGVSLALLGLLAAAAVTIDALDHRAGVPTALLGLAALVGCVPLVAQSFVAPPTVVPAAERTMPAFVMADALVDPEIGTLVIRPIGDGTISARLERGAGTTLDDHSTATETHAAIGDREQQLASIAVNLIAGADIDPSSELDAWGVRYVLLAPAGDDGAALRERAERSLEQRGDLTAIGATQQGLLWQRELPEAPAAPERPASAPWILGMQLVLLAGAALLALPSARRGARTRSKRQQMVTKDWA